MTRKHFLFGSAATLLLPGVSVSVAERQTMNDALTLWYDRPATHAMNEALPIGNGRLGGLVFGGTASERIVFNVDSLWTGDANPSGNYDTMGAYQMFGDLFIELPDHEATTSYRRTLNLENAVGGVHYVANGTTYTREYFVSAPDQVLAIRFTADKPGSHTGTIRIKDAHGVATVASDHELMFAGGLGNGLKYEARLRVLVEGGTVQVGTDSSLSVSRCDSVTLLLVAGTDYAMEPTKEYRGDDPHPRLTKAFEIATKKGYASLRAAHVADYQKPFHRVKLNLGKSPAERTALPTDRRKVLAAKGGDPEMEALLFQYGRYLLISSSRPGTLPANLQGIWNDSNDPAWHSDYHTNINIQMNYWLAEPTNLSEFHLPLFDLIESQLPEWRKATAAAPEFKRTDGKPVRGWAVRTSHNITGGMGWEWDNTANAWYCRHFYEHWIYTGDRKFLRDRAYPVLKETCEFWQDQLKTLPDGRIVVPNVWSPEHGPREDGVSYSQEIVWDLFSNYLEAAEALDIDADYRKVIAGLRDKLVTPKIGRWGQLQEWMTDRDDPNDHHRHTSHLYGVYPGRQIDMVKTPELAVGAAKSLTARGDTGDVREWSFAWRAALWARLHDGERAHGQLLQLFADRNTCPNLFGLHPPMQIDGNFGITTGMAEMLLQSMPGEMVLLPALPAAWASGSVTGLCGRGGYRVDLQWSQWKLTAATIHATTDGMVRVRYGYQTRELILKKNERYRLGSELKPTKVARTAPS